MINQIFRFLFIFITIFILFSLTAFVYNNSGLQSYFILNNPSSSDFFKFLNYYLSELANYFVSAFFLSLFTTVLFFMNTRQFKLGAKYKNLFILSFLISIILSLAFVIFIPQKYWENTNTLDLKGTSNSLISLYKKSKILNINGKTIYYASFNKKNKNFNNVIITSSESYQVQSKKNNKPEYINEKDIFFAKGAVLNYKTGNLDIKEAVLINPIKSKRVLESISIDMNQLHSRLYIEKASLTHGKQITNLVNKIFKFLPIQSIHHYIIVKAKLFNQIVTGEVQLGQNIFILLSIILEWISTFVLVSALAVLLLHKSVPFINFTTSLLATLILIYLSFNYLPSLKIMFSFSPSLEEYSSVIVISVFAIIFQLLAINKYRKQKSVFGNGQEG